MMAVALGASLYYQFTHSGRAPKRRNKRSSTDFSKSSNERSTTWPANRWLRVETMQNPNDVWVTQSPETVDPLPFHGMKSYPYLPEVHSDDPAVHRYREEYNTRRVGRDKVTPSGKSATRP